MTTMPGRRTGSTGNSVGKDSSGVIQSARANVRITAPRHAIWAPQVSERRTAGDAPARSARPLALTDVLQGVLVFFRQPLRPV